MVKRGKRIQITIYSEFEPDESDLPSIFAAVGGGEGKKVGWLGGGGRR